MAELKTKKKNGSGNAFINSIDDEQKRSDARKIAAMMRKETGKRAKMWGANIVGCASYHYKYASGREGDWPIVEFSPRERYLSLYIMPGLSGVESLMDNLCRYKAGKSCLYIKRIDYVDRRVLERLIDASVSSMCRKYETG